MNPLLKNWKIVLLAVSLMIAFFAIATSGVQFGTDFKGGTVFLIQLAETPTTEQMQTIRSVVEQRLDGFGLKDTTVTPEGGNFLRATIAENDPKQIESIERILRTQGKFEVLFDGNVLFNGSDIIEIVTDPANGYRVTSEGGGWTWILPFMLKESAAQNFSRGIFHKCLITGAGDSSSSGRNYDCEKTYFFIDRPSDSVLIIPKDVYSADTDLFTNGTKTADIPSGSDIKGFLLNSGAPYLIVDSNLSKEDETKLNSLFLQRKKAVIPSNLDEGMKQKLTSMGFDLKEVAEKEGTPWVWIAGGGKAIIQLTPGIANMEPYVKDVANAKTFSTLTITGSSASKEDAFKELTSLRIILQTGSLPIGIDDISKEVVSPALGSEFLNVAMLMGLFALLTVSIVIFIRYKHINLAIPIMFTALAEITLVLGFASIIKWNLDLASVAGLIAAVGTGVNDQIVITDELLARQEEAVTGSLLNRVKKAFFIIFAAASTAIAAMAPLLIMGGTGKLSGFALTTIIGVLVGILITRPAYSDIARDIIEKENIKKQ